MQHRQLGLVPAILLAAALVPIVAACKGAPLASDNSRQNESIARTADNQPDDVTDRQVAASARKAIVADKSLSLYAHNVKIIAAGNQVTLEGPVHSAEERDQVGYDVAAAVGRHVILNKLTIV